LENWIYENATHRSELIVATPEFIQYKKYDPEDVEYIIKRIKRYYTSGTLYESKCSISYKDISDLDRYKKSANEILGGWGSQSDNGILDNTKEIYVYDKLVGYISFEEFDDIEGYNKALGFGNFMILDRGKGYGT